MHSKIIIASLICTLAANFGNFKNENTVQRIKPITEETTCCSAPNEHHAYAYVSNERGSIVAGGWFEIITDIQIKNKAWNTITERDDPYSLLEGYFSYCGDLGVTINIPDDDGDYYIGFGIDGGEVAKAYIFVRQGSASVSMLSKSDARAKYFMDYEATSTEKNLLQGYAYGYSELTLFNAEKRYGDFVYGNNDVRTTINCTNNNTPLMTQMFTKPSVDINIHATWYDKNGTSHPLAGVKTEILSSSSTSLLSPSEALFRPTQTNENGDFGLRVSYERSTKIKLNQLKLRLTAINNAVAIDNNYGIDYTYCFSLEGAFFPRITPTAYLNSFLSVNYNISFYCGRSDRANAFEITQAERLPYIYCNNFTDGVSSCHVLYPSMDTHYSNNAGEGKAIRVRYDDFENWDVLNHEYGHHICDSLEICYVPGMYKPHEINEDLFQRYGADDGFYLSWSEGLATYIGIASQLYDANEINVPGVGDLRYDDPLRNVSVDYSQRAAGLGYSVTRGERYECCVTSVLLKILQSEEANISDKLMWKALLNARFDGRDYACFFDKILDLSFGGYDAICQILIDEHFSLPHDYAEWTIMIYLDSRGGLEGAMLEDIEDIIKLGTKPSDVNIIIQVNESSDWPKDSAFYNRSAGRYHIEKGNLVLDELLPNGTDVTERQTMNSFFIWGLSKYPARKTGIVFNCHGAGIYGISNVSNKTITDALEYAFAQHGVKERLEFVAYDACGMQVQDTAELNSKYFKYMVGSEEGVNIAGLLYGRWIEKVYNNGDTETILKEMAHSYVDYLWEINGDRGQTMSVLNLTKMQDYKDAFENLAETLQNYITLPLSVDGHDDYGSLGFVIRQSKHFGNSFQENQTIDGLDFLYNLRNNNYITTFIGTDAIDDAISCYKNVICDNATGSNVVGRANGMSIYTPFCRIDQYTSELADNPYQEFDDFDYPLRFTNFINWRRIFKNA